MVEDVREEGLAGATVSVQKTEQIRLVRQRSAKACPLARPMAVQPRVTPSRVCTDDSVAHDMTLRLGECAVSMIDRETRHSPIADESASGSDEVFETTTRKVVNRDR